MSSQGAFIISLDFELFWGVRDKTSLAVYGPNILGVRQAIPAMLKIFREFGVKATWAAVGMVLCDTKAMLKAIAPAMRPSYTDVRLDPYRHLKDVGTSETNDPYHFGASLARQIVSYPEMELASHTFSHYCCLEPGQTLPEFEQDLASSVAVIGTFGRSATSLVFPRNQYNCSYLQASRRLGFTTVRGNHSHWCYREGPDHANTLLKRSVRLADTYLPVSGDMSCLPAICGGLTNIPASSFLRPYNTKLRMLDPLKLRRILGSMSAAAKTGRYFHLWWHPHNFGVNQQRNIECLRELLRGYATLRDRYGFRTLTMADVGAEMAAIRPGDGTSRN